MKTWQKVALGLAVAAVAYVLYRRSTSSVVVMGGGNFAPPAVGPTSEARRGPGHF